MDVADLRIFQTVAQCGGMNKAAVVLNTVQSNVTARIRQLEGELGRPLFVRHSRGVTLTDAGRRLLPYAGQIRELLSDAIQATRDDGVPSGRLTLGALETTTALRLSPLLARYVAAYPDVDFVLRTGTTAEMLQAVLAHDVEAAFVCGPVAHPRLAAVEVFREELVLLAPPGMACLRDVLAQQNLRIIVLKAGCSYRQRLEDVLARRGVVAPRLLEFGTLEAVGRSVSAGLGITMLPRRLIGTVWSEGSVSVMDLPRADAEVSTVFVHRRDGYISRAMQAFVDLCRAAPDEGPQRSRRSVTASARESEAVSPGDSMP